VFRELLSHHITTSKAKAYYAWEGRRWGRVVERNISKDRVFDDEIGEFERACVAFAEKKLLPFGHGHSIQQPELAPALYRPAGRGLREFALWFRGLAVGCRV